MRTVHEATQPGIGDARSVYFLWGLRRGVPVDEVLAREEQDSVADDVRTLTAQGYTVVVDSEASRRTLREALYSMDPELAGHDTAAVYWSSHGNQDGSLQLSDGRWVAPGDIDAERVTPGLAWVVFSSCHTGTHRAIWQERLGAHVKVVAWSRVLGGQESLAFNTPDPGTPWGLDDLIRELLLPGGKGGEAIPSPPEDWESPFDAGAVEFVEDGTEDDDWEARFAALSPRLRAEIRERLGLDTRRFVWRMGQLLSQAALQNLVGHEERAAAQLAVARELSGLVLGSLPALPPPRDLEGTVEFLCVAVPRSSFARGALGFGADHGALLECALRLALLVNDQAHDALRLRLRIAGAIACLPSELWREITARRGPDLFDAHDEVMAALNAQPDARERVAIGWALGALAQLISVWRRYGGDPPLDAVSSLLGFTRRLGLAPPPTFDWSRPKLAGGRARMTLRSWADALRRRGHERSARALSLSSALGRLSAEYDPLKPAKTLRRTQRLRKEAKRAGVPATLYAATLQTISEATLDHEAAFTLLRQLGRELSAHLAGGA